MTTYTIIDADGTTLGFTEYPHARFVAGFVPADDNRLVHPAFAAAMEEARNVARLEASNRVLALCADMTEPAGIRSDDSRTRWPAMLTNGTEIREARAR
jgi:hypothetical protein